MSAAAPLLSPLLVGRDDLVALAGRRLGEVGAGRGQLLLVSGEAGIGKTRLIAEIERRAVKHGFRVGRATLAPEDRDVPTAAIFDLARTIQRQPEFGQLGGELLDVAGSAASATGPGRRVLVGRIVDALVPAADEATILVFEDLQWAAELTLEILAELARRTKDRRLLLLGSYRSDEMTRDSALRGWRARLVTQRIAEDLRLARLTREETALMTTCILGTGLPAPRDVADAIYQRTDGVPLQVEELLGALGGEVTDGLAIHAVVPETLEDATLQRVARLSIDAQAVARAGAVIGRRFVPSVLAGIMDLPVDALDEPIQELVDHDVLDGPGLRGMYDFRHQLLRDALYRSVSAKDRRRFHARAAEFGAQLEGASEIHASLHFERAGMHDEAFRAALAGARAAVRLSSYREAFELYRRAIENMPAGLPGPDRATILLEYSATTASTDRVQLSIDIAARARTIALESGDGLLAARALVRIALGSRRDGHPLVERRDIARRALVELDRLQADEQHAGVRIAALEELAMTETDDRRLREARELLAEAHAIAEAHGLHADAMDAASGFAQIDVLEGRVDLGISVIRSIAETARTEGAEEVAVAGFRDSTLMAIRSLDFRQGPPPRGRPAVRGGSGAIALPAHHGLGLRTRRLGRWALDRRHRGRPARAR